MTTGRDLVEENLAAKIAAMAVTGMQCKAITAALIKDGHELTWRKVHRIMQSEEFKGFIRDYTDESLAMAKATVRSESAKLVKKAMSVLDQHLEDGNLNAVPLVFKVLGVMEPEAEKKVDGNITIVLPGAEAPKNITPEYREVEDNEV